MYVLLIIGLDPNNRVYQSKPDPLCDPLIDPNGGSHGCSTCSTGKILKFPDEGPPVYVPSNAAEVLTVAFANVDDANTWTQKYAAALAGKQVYAYESNWTPPLQST